MTTDPLEPLGLPERARVHERLTKKLLLEMAAETSSDRTLINNAVASATVEAVLTPTTVGIAEHRETGRRIQDIAVISIALATTLSGKDEARLLDLLHRSMPRPVIVLLQRSDKCVVVSVALTRVSQTDDSRSVVEAAITGEMSSLPAGSLDVSRLVRTDLWAYYQDLARAIATEGHARSLGLNAERAIAERHRLTRLEAELATVARQAQREKSLQQRIGLNARAKALRTEIKNVRASLYASHQAQQHASTT